MLLCRTPRAASAQAETGWATATYANAEFAAGVLAARARRPGRSRLGFWRRAKGRKRRKGRARRSPARHKRPAMFGAGFGTPSSTPAFGAGGGFGSTVRKNGMTPQHYNTRTCAACGPLHVRCRVYSDAMCTAVSCAHRLFILHLRSSVLRLNARHAAAMHLCDMRCVWMGREAPLALFRVLFCLAGSPHAVPFTLSLAGRGVWIRCSPWCAFFAGNNKGVAEFHFV